MIKFYILLIGLLLAGCSKERNDEIEEANNDSDSVNLKSDLDCVEFVALWPAGDIADKIGKDKKWVFLNYTVDLLDVPPSDGSGNIVGYLRASSYARIIKRQGDDYMVESPIDKAQGWISNQHVKTTSWKNPNTNALCK